MTQNYTRTHKKHREAKKGHRWTKLEKIKMDYISVNLKNFGPTFLQVYLSLY